MSHANKSAVEVQLFDSFRQAPKVKLSCLGGILCCLTALTPMQNPAVWRSAGPTFWWRRNFSLQMLGSRWNDKLLELKVLFSQADDDESIHWSYWFIRYQSKASSVPVSQVWMQAEAASGLSLKCSSPPYSSYAAATWPPNVFTPSRYVPHFATMLERDLPDLVNKRPLTKSICPWTLQRTSTKCNSARLSLGVLCVALERDKGVKNYWLYDAAHSLKSRVPSAF